jgi:hypothetical protein
MLRKSQIGKFADLIFLLSFRKGINFRINHYKFAGFVIWWTATPQKFADLQLRNEPKNLPICDLRTKKEICVPF